MRTATRSGAAVVVLRDEGHLGNGDRLHLAAYLRLQLGARLVHARGHVAHADALLQAGAEAAARGDAHLLAVREERNALAHGRAARDDETRALASRRLVLELRHRGDGAQARELRGGILRELRCGILGAAS